MSMLLELGALFNAGMRHTVAEKRSEALRRKEAGNARDDDPQVDLDGGVVYIRRRGGSAMDATDAAPAATTDD